MWRLTFLNTGLPILALFLAGGGTDHDEPALESDRILAAPNFREATRPLKRHAADSSWRDSAIANFLQAARAPQARPRNTPTGRFTAAGGHGSASAGNPFDARPRPEISAGSRFSCATLRSRSIRLQI
jgi:hypothetical protein